MLGVTIYEWHNGQDRKVGSIRLGDDGTMHLFPVTDQDVPLLQRIVTTPTMGNVHHPKKILPADDPAQFLDNLRYMYRSPYLRATAPIEMP